MHRRTGTVPPVAVRGSVGSTRAVPSGWSCITRTAPGDRQRWHGWRSCAGWATGRGGQSGRDLAAKGGLHQQERVRSHLTLTAEDDRAVLGRLVRHVAQAGTRTQHMHEQGQVHVRSAACPNSRPSTGCRCQAASRRCAAVHHAVAVGARGDRAGLAERDHEWAWGAAGPLRRGDPEQRGDHNGRCCPCAMRTCRPCPESTAPPRRRSPSRCSHAACCPRGHDGLGARSPSAPAVNATAGTARRRGSAEPRLGICWL
jgi:hypothetical protein